MSTKRGRESSTPVTVEARLTPVSALSEYYSASAASPDTISECTETESSPNSEDQISRKSTRTTTAQSASSAPTPQLPPAQPSRSSAPAALSAERPAASANSSDSDTSKEIPTQPSVEQSAAAATPTTPAAQPSSSSSNTATTSSTRRQRSACQSQSTSAYRCTHCPHASSKLREHATHIRSYHSSAWYPASHQPNLEHCGCGRLYIAGQSIMRHRHACPHLQAGQRILGPHSNCTCPGCGEHPLEATYCATSGCSAISAPTPAGATTPAAATTTSSTTAPPALPNVFANIPTNLADAIPLAKLVLVRNFEFTAEDLDISVVERIFTNEYSPPPTTHCHNKLP